MLETESPEVLLLDGDYDTSLQIAKELSTDLDAHIVGVGTSRLSRLRYSKYCDEFRILPSPAEPTYGAKLSSLLQAERPDIVVPVGYDSTAALDEIRREAPRSTTIPLPPSDSFDIAVDKRQTLSLASELGIATPPALEDQISSAPDSDGIQNTLDSEQFPVFLKPRRETGRSHSAKVTDIEAFESEYESLQRESDQDDILVQECLEDDERTYAYGLLFNQGELELSFGHVEIRSIPRRGGSGTRLQAFRDPRLESMSVQLLESLDWTGIALIEYRRTSDAYVLMEINPKFWASYALASQCGYRFASKLVTELLDLPIDVPAPEQTAGERVFPLREAEYCLRHIDDESMFEAAKAMLWPPARPDINADDVLPWMIPPANVVQKVPFGRESL